MIAYRAPTNLSSPYISIPYGLLEFSPYTLILYGLFGFGPYTPVDSSSYNLWTAYP